MGRSLGGETLSKDEVMVKSLEGISETNEQGMQVLLRSLRTNLYYASNGEWTAYPEFAFDFGLTEQAARAYRRERMSEIEIVFRTEKPLCELKVPVPGDW
jgi:hypothetical protein